MVKIKIDKTGILYLLRGNKLKEQMCSYSAYSSACEDDCPHFGEKENDARGDVMYNNVYLKICNGTILSCQKQEFIDEREGAADD